ncbi:hypothetical protein [Novosphingobium beihaiensis]|uniref:Uncharacterized protein n=1 Tax=Novosphingobium beihaiensis TaxID=2930389 RepID=A0ABT0BMH8_9SPHN|nr:hypothetical protein [Novosphingobium beihaiensis]MCJ2186237.1 hypothetical protein [Novosphingobium beihaiensis]
MTAYPQTALAQQASIPVSDARDIGPNSVRFAAAQFSNDAPTIVLLGLRSERWPVVRKAIQDAADNGARVDGIHIGPIDAEPALEIYAKGQLVTRPINPNTIGRIELTRLIQDIVGEFY